MKSLFSAAVFCMLIAFSAIVVGDDDWIGRTVIIKDGAELTTDAGKVKPENLVQMVKKVDGDWLLLAGGRIEKKDVFTADQAIEHYTTVIRTAPTVNALNSRAAAWYVKGEIDKAIQDFSEAIRLEPNDVRCYWNRANLRSIQRDYDGAIKDCDEAIRLSPKSAESYLIRGSAWSHKGDLDRAIEDYSTAIRLDPDSAQAYFVRGVANHSAGDNETALQDFSEAIRLDPSNPAAYNGRGTIWRAKGQQDKALDDYNEALRLSPNHASAYVNRAVTWSELDEFDKAIKDCTEAIRLSPKTANAFNVRGNAWKQKQDYAAALQDFNEAIRVDPKFVKAYLNRANVLELKGEYDKALQDYAEALRVSPKSVQAYSGIAWIRATCPEERFRNGAEAVEKATKACELSDWDSTWAIGTLAAAHAEAGDFTTAIAMQTKVINRTPDNYLDFAKERMALYKSGKPYRDERPKSQLRNLFDAIKGLKS